MTKLEIRKIEQCCAALEQLFTYSLRVKWLSWSWQIPEVEVITKTGVYDI
jgi:hypothetical protein